MLYAVKPERNLGPIEVPTSLDDIDGLLTLRSELDEAIRQSMGDIVLDCSLLLTISNPALGWLVELALRLFQQNRYLVLSGASAELCLKFRTLGPDLPGVTIVRN